MEGSCSSSLDMSSSLSSLQKKLNDQAVPTVPEAFYPEFLAFPPCEFSKGNIPYYEMKINWERSVSIMCQARYPVSDSSETIMWSYTVCQSKAIAEFQIARSKLESSHGCQLSWACICGSYSVDSPLKVYFFFQYCSLESCYRPEVTCHAYELK